MIGRLTGVLIEKRPPQVLLDVHGIGYEIDVPMSTYYDLPANGVEVTLYTHLSIREDMHLLFGFATESERQVFRQLIKVSGIGARTALALLSGLSVRDLYQAVSIQDSARLIKIPGIGKKTAERLLLELRDKLDSEVICTDTIPSSSRNGNDMLNALLSLGYNDREANWAINQIAPELSLTDGIRQALQLLSKER
ncbi:MAG: Holliday junction DNA helicase RuvA [Proteobacteria bacterium SG_bin4]|nr:MAG: Holliday junction DNA helicase RuvA [Proteobacteria bacterium SG_bin4]